MFQVPLLDLYPVKEPTKRWQSLAFALEHVRHFCRVWAPEESFTETTKTRTVIARLQQLLK